MEGFIYILKFVDNQKYYIGSTNNLERRIIEHRSLQSNFTSQNGNFDLVFSQKFKTVQEARKIEYKLKKLKSRKIIDKIIVDGQIKMHS